MDLFHKKDFKVSSKFTNFDWVFLNISSKNTKFLIQKIILE